MTSLQTAKDGRSYITFTIKNVFDIEAFRNDVQDYVKRNCHHSGYRNSKEGYQQMADEAGIQVDTARDFMQNRRPSSTRVLFAIAIWADLSIDKYLKTDWQNDKNERSQLTSFPTAGS